MVMAVWNITKANQSLGDEVLVFVTKAESTKGCMMITLKWGIEVVIENHLQFFFPVYKKKKKYEIDAFVVCKKNFFYSLFNKFNLF